MKRHESIFSFTLLTFLFFYGCKPKNDEPSPTIQQGNTKGLITIPSDVKIEELTIVSGFNEGKVSANPNGRTTANTYYFNVNLNVGNVQLISVLNKKEPILQCIALGDNEVNMSIDPVSTAEAMVFLHPILITNDRERAKQVRQKIKGAQAFNQLVKEVETHIQSYGKIRDDQMNFPSFENVVLQTWNSLVTFKPDYNVGSGLEIVNRINDEVKGEIRFKIKNTRKRWVNIFIDTYANNSTQPTSVDKGLYSSDDFSPTDFLPLFGDGKILPETLTDEIIVPIKGYDKVDISVYGPSFKNLPAYKSEEWLKTDKAIAGTVLTDVGLPLLDVVTGIGFKKVDYRGSKLIFDDLIIPLTEAFLIKTSESTMKAFAQNTDGGENLYWEYVKVLRDWILDPENVSKITRFIAGLAGKNASELALKSSLKSALPWYKLYSTATAGANLGFTVYALSTSDYKTTIPINSNLPPIPTNGLVAYYPFNGNANDESGNNNNGVISGATLTSDKDNKTNSAYAFNGSSFIEVKNSSTLDITKALTLSAWVQIIGNPQAMRLIDKAPVNTNNGYLIDLGAGTNSKKIRFIGASNNYASLSDFTQTSWTHIAVTFTGSKINFYINGKLDTSVNSNSSTLSSVTNSLFLGKSQNQSICNCNYFKGNLDEVRVYNRALSDTEIQTLAK